MEMFDFRELDQVMLELNALNQRGMELNAIGNAIKEGCVNRELAELSLALDPSFIDTNYYPVNSFSKDNSLVNQEVLMKGWIVNVAKSAFNFSNLSLRATVLITGAILWLISKLRKGGGKGNGSSGGSSSSSGSTVGGPNNSFDLSQPLTPFPKDLDSEWKDKLEAVYKKHPSFKPRVLTPNYEDVIPLVKFLLEQAEPLIGKLSKADEVIDNVFQVIEKNQDSLSHIFNGVSKFDFSRTGIDVTRLGALVGHINHLDRCFVNGSSETHIGEVFKNVFETILGDNPLGKYICVQHSLNVQQVDTSNDDKGLGAKDVLNNIRTDYLQSGIYGAGYLYSDVYKMLNQFDRKGRTVTFKKFGSRVDVKTDWSLLLRPVQIKYGTGSNLLNTWGLVDANQIKYQFTATNSGVADQLERLEKLTNDVKRQAEVALSKSALSKTNEKYDYEAFNLTAVKRSTCKGKQLGNNDNAFYPIFELLLEYNNYSCKLAANILQEGIVGVSQRVVKDINSELVIAKEIYALREEYKDKTGK